MSRLNLPTACRVAVYIDIFAFFFRLAITGFVMLYGGTFEDEDDVLNNHQEPSDSNVCGLGNFCRSLGTGMLFMVLFRWCVNVIQIPHFHQSRIAESQAMQKNRSGFLCCCCFFLVFIHIEFFTFLILEWTNGHWVWNVAIYLLSWEIIYFGFMISHYFWQYRNVDSNIST